MGAATFDRGVGLSRYTRQVTHHIAPDVDAERDTLLADLAAALDGCARPAFVVGPAVDHEGAVPELVELAERTRAAVWVAPLSARCSSRPCSVRIPMLDFFL